MFDKLYKWNDKNMYNSDERINNHYLIIITYILLLM
jgi:hypothetical protein